MSTHTADTHIYCPETDQAARIMASMINGEKSDPYYEPSRQPSDEDEVVYNNYETAIKVIKNPDNYNEDEVEEIIGVIRDDYKDQFSSYYGNYNADISENQYVKEFYEEYKKKMAYYKGCVTKIKNKQYENQKDRQLDLHKARKYMPNDLGKEMKILIQKIINILNNKQMMSDSDSD